RFDLHLDGADCAHSECRDRALRPRLRTPAGQGGLRHGYRHAANAGDYAGYPPRGRCLLETAIHDGWLPDHPRHRRPHFGEKAYEALLGFGFGGTLLALFMRVGGGIYTKAADVGADLVGKIEANIPEDDPRNAATIADNVGDNVGDCAGMAADIFESYEVTIVAAMILGYASFGHKGVIFPLLVRAIGVIGSIISTYSVRAGDKGDVASAMKAVERGFVFGSMISVAGFILLGLGYLHFDDGYIRSYPQSNYGFNVTQ